MSKRPNCSKVKRSEKQIANQNRFREATKYGKHVKKDPEMVALYKQKKKSNQSVWNVSISDYMLKPKIKGIDFGGYVGVQGNKIVINAWDQFSVMKVKVKIKNEGGEVLEEGEARKTGYAGAFEWEYIVTVDNPGYKKGTIEVSVKDRPGNEVKESYELDGS